HLRQLHRRIRRPVSVMTTAQRTHGPVNRDIKADLSAIAEENQRPSGWMDRTVAGDEQVALDQILMQLERALEVLRSRFLFSFQDELQIDGQRNVLFAKRVESG